MDSSDYTQHGHVTSLVDLEEEYKLEAVEEERISRIVGLQCYKVLDRRPCDPVRESKYDKP